MTARAVGATLAAGVAVALSASAAIGPADLDLGEGTNTVVYAWGSAPDKNLLYRLRTTSR
jgi:hypothetical protein